MFIMAACNYYHSAVAAPVVIRCVQLYHSPPMFSPPPPPPPLPQSVEDKSSWEWEPSCLLASLAVVGLKADGSTRDNGAMEAELFMDNFTLDDDRPGTTGIRQ